jgi:hypothetical protein
VWDVRLVPDLESWTALEGWFGDVGNLKIQMRESGSPGPRLRLRLVPHPHRLKPKPVTEPKPGLGCSPVVSKRAGRENATGPPHPTTHRQGLGMLTPPP